jgi:acyl-CoA thioesterase-1
MTVVLRSIWVLLAILPLSAAARADAILVLGDSLSAAYGMEIGESWPSLLQQRLEQHGYAYRVFNSSITGETTQGGLTRLPRLLERHQPDIVIIELGGNDGLRGLPLEVTRANLAAMIEHSQAAGARVVLAEMRIPPNYGRSYTEKFNGNYAELSERYGVVLLPFVLEEIALQPGMMQADGIHPTVEAQPVILDRVWGVLEPLL